MQKLKMESNLIADVLRHPKRHPEAFVYLAMSMVCLATVVVLNFIR